MKIFFQVVFGFLVLLIFLMPQPGLASNAPIPDLNPSPLNKPTSVPDDIYWDNRFTTRGLSGQVNAIAVSGSNVFVGGNFATADDVVVNRIAPWDGSHWFALGEGIGCGFSYCTPQVNAVAISGGNVFVGGMFTTAGGVPASSIAKWNGSSWSALGSGVNGTVSAIAISGNDVYVGGYFTNAGGVTTYSIAKWNTLTNSWSALPGGGVYGGYCCSDKGNISVSAITISGSDVYVGGYFTNAGGVDANYIAKFDGVNWSALGEGVSGDPYKRTHIATIVVNGNNVYVGGNFTMAGNVTANNIAVWDGVNWSAFGNGFGTYFCGESVVSSIGINSGIIYAGGGFSGGIATWDGFNWNVFGGGVSSDVYCANVNAITFNGTDMYVAGSFTIASGTPANYIVRWNGGSWFALGNSADNGVKGYSASVNAITINGNDVYVGGCFSKVDSVPANNVARWNAMTNTWSALGTGVVGCVKTIAVIGATVYVGGDIFWAGGNFAYGIAKWDGGNWTILGTGLAWNSCQTCGVTVNALGINGNNLYVAGSFDTAGSTSAQNIAKWDGSNWSVLGTGTNSTVHGLAINGNNIYIGGNFSTAGGVPVKNVARWDGNAWSVMGNCGIDCQFSWTTVNAIASSGNDVYVGGAFSSARAPQKPGITNTARIPSGVSASNIARWNALTNTWYVLGSGVDRNVTSIAVSGNNLYAAGNFISAGNVDANYIAKWDGSNWSTLGSGLNDYANVVAASGSLVYAGGNFTIAGNKPSYHLARWFKPTNFIFLPLIKR